MCLVSFSKQLHYSALKKLDSTSMPAWAYVVICDDCSHRCSWCYGGFNENLTSAMSLDDFSIILRKLKEMSVFQVSIAGGEPTEHPRFKEFVSLAAQQGFLLHLVTHGEHLDDELVEHLKLNKVDQVQINWQGRRHHDQVHGVVSSYDKAVAGIRRLIDADIEVTTTTTIGKYNLHHIHEIFVEAAELGVTRLRVWEATGRGNVWRKNLDTRDIFNECRRAARLLGYEHCLSYDPVYQGDVSIPCLQFSNLYMYITSRGTLNFCGAVEGGEQYADFLDENTSAADIKARYLRRNREILQDHEPYCMAREGLRDEFKVVSFKY